MSSANLECGSWDAFITKRITPATTERFWAKVATAGPSDCWQWLAARDSKGYGNFFIAKIDGWALTTKAHRWAYLALRSNDIAGLTIDHLCRNRLCVNPWHLEPVTNAINCSRQVSANGTKTHCKRGHPLIGDNLGHQNGGYRYCRACKRMTDARRWGQ